MASSSGERANAAYDRALQAFEQRAYDVARSWALHALNEDPHHAGARALLTRLDAARPPANPFDPPTYGATRPGGSQGGIPRKGPEPISVDPNILISRASGSDAPEPIEPTMIIQRDDPRLRLSGARVRAPAPPSLPYTPEPPVAEPTVIVQPNQRAASGARSSGARTSGARSSNAAASGGPSLWQRLRSGGNQSASPQRSSPTRGGGTTSDRRPGIGGPELRGALIAVAAVAVASLLVWGAILGWGWLWPDGELLTIKKPVGGTITGAGLRCGTLGSDCSTTLPTGDRVQLEATADADYVYSGFNGDCSPTGVSLMSEPRTCGATFDPVAPTAPTVTITLTITKPTGGTVVGPMDILCGHLGSTCVAAFPSGVPVNLRYEAEDGHTFSQFTGDCAANGEVTMTAARTCSATFTQTTERRANVEPSGSREPSGSSEPSRRRPQREQDEIARVKQPQQPPPTPPPPSTQQPTGPQTPTPVPPVVEPPPPTGDKAAAPITAEEHAKKEIDQLVKNYCADLETLQADRIKKWFPLAPQSDLRYQFKEYKSLKCTLTLPLEYERLDAAPAGVAQVKFEMKQVIQMRSGGAPEKKEMIVRMTVSRLDLRSPWQIDRMRAEEKPKP